MANSIYRINKGINKSIEFKGLKAQYIWYMAGVLAVSMGAFVLLYLFGVNHYICLAIAGTGGAVLGTRVYALSSKYGEHGLTKMMARRGVPGSIRCRDRKIFVLKNPERRKAL